MTKSPEARINDFFDTVYKPGTQVAQGFYIAQQRALPIIREVQAENKRLRFAIETALAQAKTEILSALVIRTLEAALRGDGDG